MTMQYEPGVLKWVLRAGVVAVGVGAAVCFLLPVAQAGEVKVFPSIQLFGFMLAAIAISAILGFIFGVPRSRTETQAAAVAAVTAAVDTAVAARVAAVGNTTHGTPATGYISPTPPRYEGNSNLEQISDWLTKILVGAGLVQLATLPSALRSLGDYLGGSLGFAGAGPVAVAVVLYGVGVGFLFAYLWARLRLRVLLEISEKFATEIYGGGVDDAFGPGTTYAESRTSQRGKGKELPTDTVSK